jgi:hypothetical protein
VSCRLPTSAAERFGALALYLSRAAVDAPSEVIMRESRSLFDLAMESTMAATSMVTTLWRHLPVFWIASVAGTIDRQTHAARTVDQQTAGFIEGCVNANLEIARVWNALIMGQFAPIWNAPFAITDAGLRPALRRAHLTTRRIARHEAAPAFTASSRSARERDRAAA